MGILYGGNSNDELLGLEEDDLLFGGLGNDGLWGALGADQLFGGTGNDMLDGGWGADTLDGGWGADALYGGEGYDFAVYWNATSGVRASLENSWLNTGEAAGDVYESIEGLQGSAYEDELIGNASNNSLYGHEGFDWLFGRVGDDYLNGGGGSDVLDGGAGSDFLAGGWNGFDYASYASATTGVRAYLTNAAANTGDAAGDTYESIEGMHGSGFADVLGGDARANDLFGREGHDTLLGEDGSDSLFGELGNDTLVGGEGRDLLYGGAGSDRLEGGSGGDTFVFNTLLGSSNVDRIVDFNSAEDMISLNRSVFQWIRYHEIGAMNPEHFTTGSAATASSHRIIYNKSTGELFYDLDGVGGVAQFKFADIAKDLALTSGHFVMFL